MKTTLLFAISLLTTVTVSAQQLASGQQYFFGPRSDYYSDPDNFYQTRFGIEGGVNMSNTSVAPGTPSGNFNAGALTSFHAGVTLDIPVAYPFSIEPELLYSQRGYAATTINGNFTQHSQYIDMPLLAKLQLTDVVGIFAGPQFSYLAGINNSFSAGFNTSSQSYYYHNSSNLYFDGVVGASVSVARNIDLRARYAFDLSQNNSNGDKFVPSYSYQVLQFGVGYKF